MSDRIGKIGKKRAVKKAKERKGRVLSRKGYRNQRNNQIYGETSESWTFEDGNTDSRRMHWLGQDSLNSPLQNREEPP